MSGKKPVVIDPVDPVTHMPERLHLKHRIGQGGMSHVHEAHDRNLLRTKAIKLILPELAQDPTTRQRMIEEAQITAQLDHPHIPPVHELGITPEGRLYFTMKRLTGRTLAQVLAEVPTGIERDEQEVYRLLQHFLKLCDAVSFAHSRGVIHRDLKPDNVMVGDFGEVYLMDWGIARVMGSEPPKKEDDGEEVPRRRKQRTATQDGKYVGTPSYMPPEQAHGRHGNTDQRSDIFALGGILYEILTGRPPYQANTTLEMLFLAADGEVAPPEEVVDWELPPRLCKVCARALSKEPEARYASVAEMAGEIESFLQSGWQFPGETFAAGDVIVQEGDTGDRAFIVTSGLCKVLKEVGGEAVEIGTIGPGGVFGETAVFAEQPRNATVMAVEETAVKIVTGRHFTDDLGMGVWLSRFVKALAKRFDERNTRATVLEREVELARVNARVLHHLLHKGEDTEDGYRRAAWPPLCEALVHEFSRTAAEILDEVCRWGPFEVDPEQQFITSVEKVRE